jgi:hypothetical protein
VVCSEITARLLANHGGERNVVVVERRATALYTAKVISELGKFGHGRHPVVVAVPQDPTRDADRTPLDC